MSPVDGIEPNCAESVLPYRQRQTKPQNYPAIACNPYNYSHPRCIRLPWCGLGSSRTRQLFRDVNERVFETDGDGLENQETY